MSDTVIYLQSGAAHAPYLTVSLYTLRRVWHGRVKVFAWPESERIVQTICSDNRLDAEVCRRTPQVDGIRRSNRQFIDKVLLMQSSQVGPGANLYLDADTIVNGVINPLFEQAYLHGFCATQFNDWHTGMKTIRGRVLDLCGRTIPQEIIDATVNEQWPSPNGGVFACRRDSPVLPQWYEWARAASGVFICDEKVLHILQPAFAGRGMVTALGGAYNCSARRKFQPKTLRDEDVVIWHGHGDGFTRPDKAPTGSARWWALYVECIDKNIGGIRDWRGKIRHEHLDAMERSSKTGTGIQGAWRDQP